jgi:predicted DNA-binding protein
MATKTESVAIKVSPEEKERIKRLAENANTTVSKYLYKIIEEAIKP